MTRTSPCPNCTELPHTIWWLLSIGVDSEYIWKILIGEKSWSLKFSSTKAKIVVGNSQIGEREMDPVFGVFAKRFPRWEVKVKVMPGVEIVLNISPPISLGSCVFLDLLGKHFWLKCNNWNKRRNSNDEKIRNKTERRKATTRSLNKDRLKKSGD